MYQKIFILLIISFRVVSVKNFNTVKILYLENFNTVYTKILLLIIVLVIIYQNIKFCFVSNICVEITKNNFGNILPNKTWHNKIQSLNKMLF